MLGLLGLVAFPVRAEEGCLAALYERFLTGQPTRGFVAFERRETDSPVHSSSRAPADTPQYWAFLWQGPQFVLARSEDASITNETSLACATRFYGYDGEVYWKLSVDSVRTFVEANGAPGTMLPAEAASAVTVFSKEESAQARAGDKSNRSLSGVLLRAADAWRVAHMGFSFPLAERPTLVSSNLLLLKDADGRCQKAQFTGPKGRPTTLEYFASTNARGDFRVTMGYQTNTLLIDTVSSRQRQPMSTISYKVLAARVPASALPASVFSCKTYQPAKGKVIDRSAQQQEPLK